MSNTRQRKRKQKFKALFFGLIGIYILIAATLYFLQEQFLFRPNTLVTDYKFQLSYSFEEYNLKADDNAIINALYIKAEKPKGAILYFHGNAGDLQRWGKITEYFVARNYDVLVMDYRTYGKSTGKLGEALLYEDAHMCYQFLKERWNEGDITIYGRSLGSVMATKVASINNPSQLILEAPFYSVEDVAKKKFPIFPVKHLLKYKFPNFLHIQTVQCPISILHGTNDLVVPYTSGHKLFEISPKEITTLTSIENGGHNDLVDFESYHKRINQILP